VRPITRRAFLLASLGAVAAIFGTLSLSTGLKSWMLGQIEQEFGADITRTDDAARFADDFIAYLKSTDPDHFWKLNWYFRLKPRLLGDLGSREIGLRRRVIDMFLLSTNYVLARETGADLHYVAICDPYLNPCSNQLNASHLGARAR
jgi:hypothetical protein